MTDPGAGPVEPADDVVVERLVERALASRGAAYQDEIRRLMDAGLAVMVRGGAAAAPRVADIVAEAKVSNETFYRYFPTKGALMAAVLDAGTERLRSYLTHHMAKEQTPEGRIRRWVDGIFTQTREDLGTVARAVLVNASISGSGAPAGRHFATTTLAALLHEPFAALGNPDPAMASMLAAHGTLGIMADHVDAGTRPSDEQRERITGFCIATARAWATPSD
ncbi:TetR/AcrR family transcriptional regulator [Trujillonella endophytica]|uniref:Transcriptional regulator, TetR family n=1 Tax=Trujillonella endophytica TaxID=673521 RepID=A0A1H8WHV5_9ACTN|nr:TetR/AcrR family transcriptional regulator [Trujillella endophytica]SEP27226.1 transcriptional regulator, TetR family [Trujillella endophytica]